MLVGILHSCLVKTIHWMSFAMSCIQRSCPVCVGLCYRRSVSIKDIHENRMFLQWWCSNHLGCWVQHTMYVVGYEAIVSMFL